MKVCTNCGERIEDNSRFCPVCGFRLEITKHFDVSMHQPKNQDFDYTRSSKTQQMQYSDDCMSFIDRIIAVLRFNKQNIGRIAYSKTAENEAISIMFLTAILTAVESIFGIKPFLYEDYTYWIGETRTLSLGNFFTHLSPLVYFVAQLAIIISMTISVFFSIRGFSVKNGDIREIYSLICFANVWNVIFWPLMLVFRTLGSPLMVIGLIGGILGLIVLFIGIQEITKMSYSEIIGVYLMAIIVALMIMIPFYIGIDLISARLGL
jgi:hypothetical protein